MIFFNPQHVISAASGLSIKTRKTKNVQVV